MKFYEEKYRFEMKDLRPFGQHTKIKELNPLHNEDLFNAEIKKMQLAEKKEKREEAKRFRVIEKDITINSFYQPL